MWLFLIFILGKMGFEFVGSECDLTLSALCSVGDEQGGPGNGGNCRDNDLFLQKDIAGMTGPYTSLNCSPSGSPFLKKRN